jgi:predicted transcriptional regulator
MTATVKLDAQLEESLRQHAAASGRTTSDVIRAALVAYLEAQGQPRGRSAAELGADLFGRFLGPPDLATRRKAAVAEVWADKHARRP